MVHTRLATGRVDKDIRKLRFETYPGKQGAAHRANVSTGRRKPAGLCIVPKHQHFPDVRFTTFVAWERRCTTRRAFIDGLPNLPTTEQIMEKWMIVQVMRINADADTHIALHYTGNEIATRNALDLSRDVARHIKLDVKLSGLLTGTKVRVYSGIIEGTNDAVVVTLSYLGPR